MGIDQKIPFLEKINERIFELDTRVKKATVHFSDDTGRIMVVNSEGLAVEDYLPNSRLSAGVLGGAGRP